MYFCKMRIEITLISMVLVFRGCYCAVNNNNTVIVRASSSNTNTTSANSTTSNSEENPLRNVIKCFKADSLFKCFRERIGLLVNVWQEALINSVRRNNGDEPLVVNHSFEGVIRELGNAVYYGFTSFFYNNASDLEEARLLAEETNSSDQTKELDEQRGHHKKKKVHKEIKKIVIKIIIAIALFMLKIKAILGMIQSIIITKFILFATIYVFTLAFRIWWEIKQHKLHDKSVIYYDNEHHGHYYDAPEHEYDDHLHHDHTSFGHHDHGLLSGVTSGWGLWGRSYAPTTGATPIIPPAYANAKPLPYYIRPKLHHGAPNNDEEEFS
ncbi:uncharacterized protein LOC135843487 [Planococcus citri]|uniref:uncharacterized protein LOC135843487 n=1 Tax=Planococcus citri TaxID=170843 RepID=UPI0031F8FC73